MFEIRPRTKRELKLLFTNLRRKGITDEMVGILIDLCYNEPVSFRTSGFYWAGNPDAVMTWSNSTRTLTLTPRPADTDVVGYEDYVPHFRLYSWAKKPILHDKGDAESIVLPDEEGLFLVYYETNGDTGFQELTYIKNPDNDDIAIVYINKVAVSFIYWDATANEAIHIGDDRHGSEWNPAMHVYLHEAFQARRKSGLAVGSMELNGDGTEDSHARFSVSAGEILHDDITLSIPAAGGTSTIPVLYFLSSGHYPRFVETTGFGVYKGASRLGYNMNGSVVSEVLENYYVMYHLFAVNEHVTESRKVISVMGLDQYEYAAEAFDALENELIALNSYMPQQGRCYLGTMLFLTSETFENSVGAIAVSFISNFKTHPPVTIADGSEDYLSVDEKQVLSFAEEKLINTIQEQIINTGEIIYLHGNNSDITGYKQALPDEPNDIEGTVTGEAANTDGEVLIEEFATESDYPGVTIIPAGYWIFETFCKVDTLSGVNTLKIIVYKRDNTDTETELFNVTGIIETTDAGLLKIISPEDDIVLQATDRLVFKYYFSTTSTGTRTATVYYEGAVNYSRIRTGIIQETSGQSGGLAEIPFEFCVDAGVSSTHNIDIYSTLGYTISKAILESDGTLEGVKVQIGSVDVTGLDDMDVSTVAIFTATAANVVVIGDRVTIVTSGTDSGTPTLIRGKIVLA